MKMVQMKVKQSSRKIQMPFVLNNKLFTFDYIATNAKHNESYFEVKNMRLIYLSVNIKSYIYISHFVYQKRAKDKSFLILFFFLRYRFSFYPFRLNLLYSMTNKSKLIFTK